MAPRRPRRGGDGPDVLVSGDTGQYHPQGGDWPGASESGDLESREFGVPEADLPGGKGHVINPQTRPVRPGGVPERPADYHKYHGVPSDDGLYVVPDGEVGDAPRPVPVPKGRDAIPVYIVAGANAKTVRLAVTDEILLPAIGSDPARVCNWDLGRDEVMLLCTDTGHDALFSDDRASLADATTTAHGRCAFLSHTAVSYTRVATQGELWATSADANASHLAIIIITTVAAGQSKP